jgi:hypothetical protein
LMPAASLLSLGASRFTTGALPDNPEAFLVIQKPEPGCR